MTMKKLAERPEPRYPLSNATGRLALTFQVWPLCSAQPLESPSDEMRNKITQALIKVIILVVPRRTAGAG
jgi:hypothetical protein